MTNETHRWTNLQWQTLLILNRLRNAALIQEQQGSEDEARHQNAERNEADVENAVEQRGNVDRRLNKRTAL